MASEEDAGPSKKEVKGYDDYCGLTKQEVLQIRKIVGDETYLDSDEEIEPFEESGSEYLPSEESTDESDVESGMDENNEENRHETSGETIDNDDADKKDYSEINITWTKEDFSPKLHTFDESNSGVKNDTIDEDSCESDYFLNLFTQNIAQHIISETNRYAAQQKEKNWKELDIDEFFHFIALTMLMTRSKKLDIKEYWSLDPLLISPVFGKQMSRDRYLQILRYLHFANNEEVQLNNRLYKVQDVLEQVKERFKTQFYPFQNLVIDESMILFKGRLSFKQYIKTKRHRFGIKLYVLCDCDTGIVLDFIVYTGKDTNITEDVRGLGASGNVVAALMKPYLNKGHSLFTDNFYSSPVLSHFLFEKKLNSCGTVRSNRIHMPNFDAKLKKGEIDWKSSEIMLALKWKDRRDVTMITTMHENKFVTLNKIDRLTQDNVKKPMCVVEYNERMGAVDRSDMMMSSINCMRKSVKWYKKLFFHTLDICLLNSHAMFSTRKTVKIPLAKFQLNLVRQIFTRFRYAQKSKVMPMETISDFARLTERHFPFLVPETPNTKAASRRCIVCSHAKQGQKREKFPDTCAICVMWDCA